MSLGAEFGPTRVVLTLVDTSTRIHGVECDKVLATADSRTVDLRIGTNGKASLQTYAGVDNVLYEGTVRRLLRQRGDGELTLEYPQRLARVDYCLLDGRLALQVDGREPAVEEGVKVLIVE